ncbi:hypothetical protein ABLG96_21285 [Nakamurella sp. A5-74]|uniref:adenosine deaminase n=1 Tax=Nakamurella sp. A5-74 TaxID=3158264 RepID=A0AAU8DNC3_9ACTN
MSARLPLVDLHRHFEDSIRPSTILEIARREAHPLASAVRPRDLMVAHEHGVPVSLNTDNPQVSAVTLAHEHRLAQQMAGLTDEQLAAIAHRAVAASFVPQQPEPDLQ